MDIQILAQEFYIHSLSNKKQSEATVRRHKYVIDSFCRFTNSTDIFLVTEVVIRKLFRDGEKERKWSQSTSATYYASLRAFFEWCVQRKYCVRNPMEGITKPKFENRPARTVSLQDALRILEIVDNSPSNHPFVRYRNHAMFAAIVCAGLRKRDILGLKFADVNVVAPTVFIRYGREKDRIMEVHNLLLVESFQRYMKERKRLRKTCAEFFASLRDNSGLTEIGFRRLIKAVNQSSGISFTIQELSKTLN